MKEGFLKEGRSNCPSCGNKNTFSVTREGTELLYHCFHSSCGIKGRIKDDLSLDKLRYIPNDISDINPIFNSSNIRNRQSPKLDYSFVGLNADCITYLSAYSISNRYFQELKYDPKQNRLVFPLINHEKELRGYVGRALDSGTYPKWMVYQRIMDCPYVLGRQTLSGNSKISIIVEDCISALRICHISNAIAILGTSISSGVIPYLTPYSKLFVALDPDALHKSVKLAKYLNYFVPTEVLPITKDLKYYSDEELEEIRKKISE